MCKKHVLLLLLFALFAPWAAFGQTLTLYEDATETNEYVPFYGYYADAAQQNQMIYPASELADMAGKSITQMVFYIGNKNGSQDIGNWIVSLGETEETTLSGLDETTPLTQVYSGAMTFNSDETLMTVTFTDGYTYGGKNLLVEFNHPVTAGYKRYYFTGETVEGASYCYNGQRNFLPKITFSYETPASCAKPTGLAADLTEGDGTVATLSWTENGTATNWVLQTATDVDFTTGLVEYNVSTTPSKDLTGLTAETTYYARVKASCSASDQSEWSSVINFTPTDAISITVNDGTSTNGLVPIYGNWADNYSRSQFIIPADDLADMQWGNIAKMTFYAAADKSWGAAKFEVYMTETSETTLSSLVDWTTMEKVMNAASLSISGNVMEVTLDAPYQYMGGNLLVGINQTVSGTYSSCSWYGVSASGASMGGYGSSISQQNFLPKTTFAYLPGEEPSCFKPTELTVDYEGGLEAIVSWTSDATAWNIDVNGTVTAITENPYTLTDLELATTYEVKVQTNCDGTTSDWTNAVSFTTDLCMPEDMCEISYSFTDQYNDSWNGASINVVDVATSTVLTNLTMPNVTGPYTGSFAVCDSLQIQFVWVSGNYDSECGYTFTDLNGEEIFSGSGALTTVIYTVDCTVPTCFKPINLAAELTEGDGTIATLTWTDVSEASNWLLQYGTNAEFAEGSYAEVTEGFTVVGDTAVTANLTGLTPETRYYARVKAVCSDEDQSDWSSVMSFKPSNCLKLTVNEGTTTNTYIPVYYYVSSSYSMLKSQFIIRASELDDVQWGEIHGLSFYNNLESVSYGNATYSVYVAEVADTTLTAFADWNSLTEVYTGSVSVSDGMMVIEFDEPFPYNDGNLLVGFYQNTTGTNPSSSAVWLGVNGVAGSSRYNTSSYGTGTSSSFLPMTTVAYMPNLNPVFHEITVEANPEVGGTVTGGGSILEGRGCIITATADHFYEFINWTKDGVEVTTDNSYTITNVTEDATYVANFNALPTFTVTVTANLEDGGEYGIIADTNLFLSGETCIVYAEANEGYEFLRWENESGETVSEEDMFELTVTNDTAFVAIFDMYPFVLTATPDTIDLGEVPSGAWMRPVPFSLTNGGVPDELNSFTFSNGNFGVDLGEYSLPFTIGFLQTVNLGMTWGEGTGTTTGNLIVGYGSEGLTAEFPVTATFYTPVLGDVWENPFVVSSFPYTYTVNATTMHKNYVLPLAEIEDGNEAVYKIELDQDALLSASVIEGENGKVFLYEEGFQGLGGPDEENFYGNNRGSATRGVVELTVCDGTTTNSRIPVNGTYVDTQGTTSEFIIPAETEGMSDMVGGTISKVTFYIPNPPATWGSPVIQLYIGEVEGTTISSLYGPTTEGFTVVSTSVWDNTQTTIEVEFDIPYTYEGGNLLIGTYVQTKSSYKTTNFAGVAAASGASRYNNGSGSGTAQSFLPKTTFTYEPAPSAAPAIDSVTLMPGVYYLVASSTSDEYIVSIETADLPCPEMAYEPTPADGAIEVNETGVTLKWNLSDFTTSYTLLFGTDPEELEPIVDWTRELETQYVFEDTLNCRTTYFWQIGVKNDGCPNGVFSDVWSFTTFFTSPSNLTTATGETEFAEGDEVQLVWDGAPENRVEMVYAIYQDQDTVALASTVDTTYTIVMPYGIHNYQVIAQYTLDSVTYERSTNTLTLAGLSYGMVEGFVYEADSVLAIPNATVIIYGNDDLGLYREYEFTTDEDGYYTGEMAVGFYTGTYAMAENYESNISQSTTSIALEMNDFEDQTLIVGAESSTDYPWVITSDANHTEGGQYSLRSGNKNANSTVSYVGMYVTYAEADTLSFFCKISSEANYDKGYFSIDDVVQSNVNGISGNGSWISCSYPMTAGTHVIIWYYAKDSSTSSNDDCFYIDDVDFGTGVVEGIFIESEATTSNVNFYLNDVLYMVDDLYVSRTGYAMWEGLGESEGGTRHFNDAEIYLTALVNDSITDTIFMGRTPNTYYQLPVEVMENGNTYWCHVKQSFTSGESDVYTTEFVYESCDNFEVATNLEGVLDATGVTLTWEYPTADSTAIATPMGAFLFRDGEWLDLATTDNYLDPDGLINSVYEMRVVYDGQAVCPDSNYYYAMSCFDTIPVRYAQYEISATVEPAEAGEVTGTGLLNYSSTAVLTAVAAEGYTFDHWTTAEGEEVEAGETLSFTVTEPASFVAVFTLNNYDIEAVANPEDGGTVEGAGNYDHFSTCTLIATPATGYHFLNWMLDNEAVSTADTLSFEVTGPATYVAVFEINAYEIVATADPEEGGSIFGAGTYEHFTIATLTAAPNTGYTFLNWTKDGEEVSTNETISDTVTGPATYVAHFELNSYEITAMANPEEGGTVEGAGTYYHFETVTLTATAAEGYTFEYWTKGGDEFATTETITDSVTGPAVYVAYFSLNSYEITAVADPEEGGEVEGAGTYDHFAEVTLTATAAEGYTFINWTKDGEEFGTTETITDTVTGPADYVAYFELNSYDITVVANPEEGGEVDGAGTYNHFETVTLTATAAEGYTFINWTKDGEEVSTDAIYAFTATEGGEYVANFELNSYEITAVANPEEGGTATGGGNYNHFDQATLTATAATGYTFINWTMGNEVVSDSTSITVEVTGPADYLANFMLNSYEITVSVDPAEGGIITGDTTGVYNHFDEITLSAMGAEGYTFINWTKNGTQVSTEIEFTATVTEEAEYVAHFTHNAYVVTVVANPEEGGTVEGSDGYDHGDIATLTATAADGYTFINWTKDGEEVSTDNPYSLTVTETATYVANFELNSYEITAVADPEEGGEVEGAGTYNYGETCTLTATANEGYTFMNWTLDGEVAAETAEFEFTVEGAADYVANFEQIMLNVVATANPTEGGTITGAGEYAYGTEVTLTATANEGYNFVNWIDAAGEEVAEESTYSFTVYEDATFVAVFEQKEYYVYAIAEPEDGGETFVNNDGLFHYGDTVIMVAAANEGYTFLNWTKDGEEVTTDLAYTFIANDETLVDGDEVEFVANFELNSYEITAVADPEEGGQVEGAGIYNYGDNCTLTATPVIGYTFMNWTKDGEVVAETAEFEFTVEGAADYVANFELIVLNVVATANPTEGGTITGAGEYDYGTEVTLTATANEGYTFLNWTYGNEVITDNPYSFTVTEDAEFVANFELNSYEITAVADPEEGGEVEGAGTYNHFDEVTLTATANEGYTFMNWTKDGELFAEAETITDTVTGPAAYVANFEQIVLNVVVTAEPAVGGTVTGAGEYAYGTEVTLTATANEGYNFVNWIDAAGEEVAEESTYSFTVYEDATFVAVFEQKEYYVNVIAEPEDGGETFVNNDGLFHYGDTVIMVAAANEGYTFLNWTKDGEEVTTDLAYTFIANDETLVDGDEVEFVANFELNSYDIVAIAAPEVGGTADGTGTYYHFEEVTLTATAAEGYHFVNWTLNGEEVSTNETYVFEVTGPAAYAYVANFEINSYEITVVANPEEGGTVTGAGTYNHFDEVTLTATAAEGYTFINWTSGNEVIGDTETVTITVTGEAEYLANFELNSYEITATVNPANAGSITGAGTYYHFDEVTLTATAATGYTFINWTKDGEVFAETETITDTVTGPAAYVANFELNSYEITVAANPEEGGEVEGAGTYNHFEEVTLTATAAEGYTFINWTKNGQTVSTNATYTFTATGGGEYVANFELNSYEITATVNPANTGTVTGAGIYNHFDEVTLTATAAMGYTFINWTMGNEVVSDSTSITFEVTGPADYVANFELSVYEITAVAEPEEGGTVTGAGSYTYMSTCMLTATANTGYTFLNWTLDGQVVSNTETFFIQVTEPADYVANFEINSFEITAVADPEDGGEVEGADTYDYGTEATLTATAAEGYTFLNWTYGNEVITDNPYSFTVTEAADFVAHFELNSYEITAVANPEDGGTVTGAGTYNHFDEVTLTATAATGYTFINWTMGNEVVSDSTSITVVVTGPADYIANFELSNITQVTDLAAGWNWWSSYVDLEENGLSLLEESIDPNGLVIKSQSNGFVNYAPGVGWYGSLANVGISNDLSYQIRMNQAAVSELSGLAVNPADHPITVYTGWTWIGYPSTNSMSVANAFNGVNPQTGDMVKSQNNGFASYLEGYGWYGALNTIEPGMGLMFKSTNTQAVTFTYGAERGELMANQKADNNHWVPNLHAYPDNMNVMAVIELNDEELRGENFELAAFANGECRGSARLLYVAPIDRYIAFLTVAGESEAELYFGLYDAETGLELLDATETLDFTVNAVVGSFDEPFVVHFRNTTGTDEDILSMQVYPNPTQTGRTYSLGTLNNNLSNIRIEVINALGAVVAVEETTELPSTFKAPATPGVYTLRITVDGKGTICRKLVVR